MESSPIEKRYNFLQSKVAEAVADDSIITTLITYIILFSPGLDKWNNIYILYLYISLFRLLYATRTQEGGASSGDKERYKGKLVCKSTVQEQHIRMLERYMYSKHPCDSANHNLATALEVII